MIKKYFFIIFSIFFITLNSKCDTSNRSKIIIYYFHASIRCETCNKIEDLTVKAVKDKFSKKLADKTIELKVINIDEDENKHFIKKYDLYMQTVVLAKISDKKEIKHKSLDKVWDLVESKEKFYTYIQDEINTFMK